jgi:hypothetical protein
MRSTGVPWDRIAHEYGVSKTRLRNYARLNGIDTGGVAHAGAVKIDWQDVQRKRMAGKTWAEIAEPYHIAGCTLSEKAKFQGLKMPPSKADQIARMESPEWDGWAEVRKMREEGVSWEDVSARIGVSDPTLRRMVAKLGMDFPAPKCRHRNGGGHVAKQMTLCWQCANAVPNNETGRGCSWSRSFKPVPGWDANDGERSTVSYHVRSCPEFVEG